MRIPKIYSDNPIIAQALNIAKGGKGEIDEEMMQWTGSDILRISYIQSSLAAGKSPEWCAKFYGVTVEGIYKYLINTKEESEEMTEYPRQCRPQFQELKVEDWRKKKK